jgi:hypothetical protein
MASAAVQFAQNLVDGAQGRNGSATTKAVTVQTSYSKNRLEFHPVKLDGELVSKCQIDVPLVDVGNVIVAMTEVTVAHSPHLKEKLAAELRAALIALEFAAPAPEDENIAAYRW